MVSWALGALLVTDKLDCETRWIKTLDLKIVTGLKQSIQADLWDPGLC